MTLPLNPEAMPFPPSEKEQKQKNPKPTTFGCVATKADQVKIFE
jgi:hypothetical protein